MKSKQEFTDLFDEDFEVTYEEMPSFSMKDNEETGESESKDRNDEYRKHKNADSKVPDYENPDFDEIIYKDEDFEDDHDETYDEDAYDGHAYYGDEDSERKSYKHESYKNESHEDRRSYRRGASGKRSRRRGGVPLAAPIQKGGKAISRLAGFLLRQLTLILILATSIYVTYTFWRASAPYGDIVEAYRERHITQTLAVYLCCVAIFLLFEFISLLWAMTRVRVRDGLTSHKEDTGRGLLSFIIVFAVSYLCFLISGFIPESPDILYGLKGAMNVYGSMHNTLFGLCAAGVISCLIRKKCL